MARITQGFHTKTPSPSRNGIAIVLVALSLFHSVRLLAGDASVAVGPNRSSANAPTHVLVISIPDRKLALTQNGRLLKVYSVAVGAAVSPSPTGTLKIINKVENPTYYHQGLVIQPGKSNPLGNRWMGLSEMGYGIHGTNVPSSIGHAVSHGCIRMNKQDVEDLFGLVGVGDVVEIHGTRDEQVTELFDRPAIATPSTRQAGTETMPKLSPAVMAALAESK